VTLAYSIKVHHAVVVRLIAAVMSTSKQEKSALWGTIIMLAAWKLWDVFAISCLHHVCRMTPSVH
jgi:hypothetical protein